MRKIFVDTGAWAALNNKRDRLHSDAAAENKKLLDERCFYITSDYVLDETYTLLLYDTGHKRAVEFGKEIRFLHKKKKIGIVNVTEILLENAWNLFVKYSDKEFSFTDCTSFAIMDQMNIKEVFSFDRHFEQYGFVRFPLHQ